MLLMEFTDWYIIVKEQINKKWNKKWEQKNKKLHQIKSTKGKWERARKINRKEEVIMNRLRAGHCRLSPWAFNGRLCWQHTTVSYLQHKSTNDKTYFWWMSRLARTRKMLFSKNGTEVVTMRELFEKARFTTNVLEFIKHIGIYEDI